MADKGRKSESQGRVPEDKRFNYIGFDVFPGKPKNLFRNDSEKDSLVKSLQDKRAKGDVLREHCTLFEGRVSLIDRAVLSIACLAIVASLFMPWFGVYNEIEETTEPDAHAAVVDTPVLGDSAMSDSALLAITEGDSLAMAATQQGDTTLAVAAGQELEAVSEDATASGDLAGADDGSELATNVPASSEEIIHGYVAKKKMHREYERISGIGMFLTLGSVGSYLFSSGGILIITVLLILIYALLCIGLPAYMLYGLYGTKGDADKRALALKRILSFNWIPVIIFFVTIFISFLGADYGFDPERFSSIGDSYSIATFLGSLSWGMIVTMGAFILVAVKGVEI